MKKLYEFKIPDLPPSLNSIYKMGQGRIYKSSDVLVFEKIAKYTLPKIKDTIDFPIGLSLTFIFKDGGKFRVSDIDNCLKFTLDMLQKFWIVKNDRLFEKLIVEKVQGQEDSTEGFLFEL